MPNQNPSWLDQWGPLIFGTGATLGGAALQSRSQNRGVEAQQQQNDWMRQMAQQELQRQRRLQALLLPLLMRSLGFKNRPVLGQMQQELQQQWRPPQQQGQGY